MMNKILFFIAIFLFCTAIGLYVGARYIPEVGDVSPITGQSVDDISSTIYFLAVVLIGTTIVLLVLKYYHGRLLYRLFEIYVIFVGSMVFWQFFILDIIIATQTQISQLIYLLLIVLVSALTVAARFIKRNFYTTNITLAIAIAGAGGALGSFMGFMPSLLFVLALGTYDIIAVFKTKHMLKLADQSRIRDLPVMFEIPSKGIKTGPRDKGARKGGRGAEEDLLGLGTGDVAIPLIFFVGILRTFNDWGVVLSAVVGAMAGLALVIYYVTHVERKALPALPPIIGMSLIGFGVGSFIFL